MDKEQLEKLIYERFKNLQPEIQAILMDTGYDQKIADISKKYQLTPEQMSGLEIDVSFVLLGQIHPEDFVSVLKDNLTLPEDACIKISADVDEQILKNVKAMIIQNFKVDAKEEAATVATTPEASPSNLPLDPRFSKLPKEVRDAVASSDYQKKLYAIGTEYKLPISKMAVLEDITVKLITAKVSPSQYETELAGTLELPKEKVAELVNAINEQIMKNIRSNMQEAGKPKVEVDEVPVPPYAEKIALEIPIQASTPISNSNMDMPISAPQAEMPILTPKPQVMVPKTEADIYSNAGIESIKSAEDEEEDDLAHTIIGSKLRATTMSRSTTTDHTLPKVGTVAPAPATTAPVTPSATKAYDPYHEAIN